MNSIRRALMLVTPFITMLGAGLVHAQVMDAPSAVEAPNGRKTAAVRVRNVRAGIMAYWLDSVNNEVPREFKSTTAFRDEKTVAIPDVATKLPVGVERVVAIDPQNSLLVFGTAAGIEEVRKLVEQLDKSLTQYEVEIQFLTVKREHLSSLFGNTGDKSLKAVEVVSGKFRSTLSALLARNSATVLTAPRHIAIKDIPFCIDLENRGPQFFMGSLTSNIGALRPNDNTVRIGGVLVAKVREPETDSFQILLELNQRDKQNQIQGGPIESLSLNTGIHLEYKAQDGDTFVLVNLPSSIVKVDKEDRASVMTVTMRKIRRFGDDAVLGAD